MKVGESETLFAQRVQRRSFQIAGRKAIDVAVTDVVNDDQDDTFWFGLRQRKAW